MKHRPTKKQYYKYLKSKTWLKKRNRVLRRDNYRCFICNRQVPLHIHHLTYDRVFHELLSDLISLCSWCHANLHSDTDNLTKLLLPLELYEKRHILKKKSPYNRNRMGGSRYIQVFHTPSFTFIKNTFYESSRL